VKLDGTAARLASLLDPEFLAGAGWDPVSRVLSPPAAHPLLGRPVCRAPGCRTTCFERTGVCLECRRRLAAHGLALDQLAALPHPRGHAWMDPGDGACAVAGCPRPWVNARRPLCRAHLD
jgi:hypothetical protein